jgi:2-succinyl-6-hydroxy-2,4-cyclohexadiene-1-carboxylate synthase
VAETLVLLHGFAGTGRLWDPVIERLGAQRYIAAAPDLRGHGAAAALRPVGFGECAADVLAAAPERFALCGYSLGGRVALHIALAAPERITRLILVATTAGIEDEAERAVRREQDLALAAATEAGTVEDFVACWSAQPLFAGDPPEIVPAWQEDMRRNDPRALAAVLRGIGTGAMRPLWQRLPELTMPATVIAGARDAKFHAIAVRLSATLPAARLVVVPGAGHGLPREAPAALAAAISAAD